MSSYLWCDLKAELCLSPGVATCFKRDHFTLHPNTNSGSWALNPQPLCLNTAGQRRPSGRERGERPTPFLGDSLHPSASSTDRNPRVLSCRRLHASLTSLCTAPGDASARTQPAPSSLPATATPALLGPPLPAAAARWDSSAVASPPVPWARRPDAMRWPVLGATSRSPEQRRRPDGPGLLCSDPSSQGPAPRPSATRPGTLQTAAKTGLRPQRTVRRDGAASRSTGAKPGRSRCPRGGCSRASKGCPRPHSGAPAQNRPAGRSSWFRPIKAARRRVWTKPVCRAQSGLSRNGLPRP